MGYFIRYDYARRTVKSFRNRSFLFRTFMLSTALLLLSFTGHFLSSILQAVLMGQGRGVLGVSTAFVQILMDGASWPEAVKALGHMVYNG